MQTTQCRQDAHKELTYRLVQACKRQSCNSKCSVSGMHVEGKLHVRVIDLNPSLVEGHDTVCSVFRVNILLLW